MLAINLSLIACFCWGLSQFLAGIKTRTLPVLTLLAYTSLSGLTVFFFCTLIRGMPIPHEPNLLFALMGGSAGIFGVYCLYHCHHPRHAHVGLCCQLPVPCGFGCPCSGFSEGAASQFSTDRSFTDPCGRRYDIHLNCHAPASATEHLTTILSKLSLLPFNFGSMTI